MPSVWSHSPSPRRTFDLNKINQERIIMSIRADDTTNTKTQQRQVTYMKRRLEEQNGNMTRCDGERMEEDLGSVERYIIHSTVWQ